VSHSLIGMSTPKKPCFTRKMFLLCMTAFLVALPNKKMLQIWSHDQNVVVRQRPIIFLYVHINTILIYYFNFKIYNFNIYSVH
jgi:hypothetical protein